MSLECTCTAVHIWFYTLLFCHMSGVTMDDNSLNVSNVKVAVRVRPMNRRGEFVCEACVRESVCVLGNTSVHINIFILGTYLYVLVQS